MTAIHPLLTRAPICPTFPQMNATVKKQAVTTGTKYAAEARKACNKLSDESRQSLTAAAMRMIYHNHAGAGEAVARRR